MSSAMLIAVLSYYNEKAPRRAHNLLIQLACLTTVYYSSILNGPVVRSILNEAYLSI